MLHLTQFGLKTFAKNIVGIDRNHFWYARLFTNNYQPNRNSTYNEFIQPIFLGYEKMLVMNWQLVDNDDHAEVKAEEICWNIFDTETSVNIKGYFITDNYDNIVFAERFFDPMFLKKNDTIKIVPRIVLT